MGNQSTKRREKGKSREGVTDNNNNSLEQEDTDVEVHSYYYSLSSLLSSLDRINEGIYFVLFGSYSVFYIL